MLQLLVSKIKPSLLTTVKRSSTLISSTFKRKASELASPKTSSDTISKDVIVYKYEAPRKFKLLNLFSISQLLFWWFIGHWSYTGMKNTKVSF
jgi:hypothetical protein